MMTDDAHAEETGEETGDEGIAGAGHNKPKYIWPRWMHKRTFVRALEGTYSNLQKGLLDKPRVYHSTDYEWEGGPQSYGKPMINPMRTEIAQSIETHFHVFAPLGHNKKHGHMNSAVFYVLEGRGYDVHDGVRMDYEAGDCLLVPNGVVHQHFNSDDKEQMLVLIMKAKPLFLFMHMLFQKSATMPPVEPVSGHEDFAPPSYF
jgi:mannose-6-phosphate isomerase-like protein (cupin superfamily)